MTCGPPRPRPPRCCRATSARAGEIDLDLRNLDLAVPARAPRPGPVQTTVSIGAGDVQVRVPENADVTVNGLGRASARVDFADREDAGPDAGCR